MQIGQKVKLSELWIADNLDPEFTPYLTREVMEAWRGEIVEAPAWAIREGMVAVHPPIWVYQYGPTLYIKLPEELELA